MELSLERRELAVFEVPREHCRSQSLRVLHDEISCCRVAENGALSSDGRGQSDKYMATVLHYNRVMMSECGESDSQQTAIMAMQHPESI